MPTWRRGLPVAVARRGGNHTASRRDVTCNGNDAYGGKLEAGYPPSTTGHSASINMRAAEWQYKTSVKI